MKQHIHVESTPTQTHSHKHTHSQTHPLTDTPIHRHTLSQTPTHRHTLSQTHPLTNTISHRHTHSQTHPSYTHPSRHTHLWVHIQNHHFSSLNDLENIITLNPVEVLMMATVLDELVCLDVSLHCLLCHVVVPFRSLHHVHWLSAFGCVYVGKPTVSTVDQSIFSDSYQTSIYTH